MIDTERKLAEIFRAVLDLADNADVTALRRLGEPKWDSLATVSLMAAVESEFSLELGPKDMERMTSFAAVLLMIKEKLS